MSALLNEVAGYVVAVGAGFVLGWACRGVLDIFDRTRHGGTGAR